MFSSTATAAKNFSAASNQNICIWLSDIFDDERKEAEKKIEQEQLKNEAEAAEIREEEFYALVATVTLTVGIIVAVFAYEYFKNRQAVKERSISSWLSFVDGKNFWIFIFCVVTLVTCLLYTPYNLVNINHPHIIKNTSHATIFDVPKHFEPKSTRIDYETIAFREVLILIGCCAGYTATKVIKKH